MRKERRLKFARVDLETSELFIGHQSHVSENPSGILMKVQERLRFSIENAGTSFYEFLVGSNAF